MVDWTSIKAKAQKVAAAAVDRVKGVVDRTVDEDIENEVTGGVTREEAEKLASRIHELQEKVTAFLQDKGDDLKQWYSDNQMNEKIQKVAKKAGATIIYPVLLLYNMMKSPNVPVQDKVLIIAPLAYFIMPVDVIPDVFAALAGAGYVDDGVAIMASLKTFSSSITPTLIKCTQEMCKNIFGEADEEVVNEILEKVTQKIESES